MSDPSLAILAALVETLRESPTIEAAFAGRPVNVWEQPPSGADDPSSADYPFIRIGEIQVVSEERIETEAELETGSDGMIADDPSEVFVTLHTFSRPRDDGAGGKPEAIRIAKAVRLVLANPESLVLEIDDDGDAFRLVLGEIRDTRHFTDADGVSAHSVLTARFEVEPTEG